MPCVIAFVIYLHLLYRDIKETQFEAEWWFSPMAVNKFISWFGWTKPFAYMMTNPEWKSPKLFRRERKSTMIISFLHHSYWAQQSPGKKCIHYSIGLLSHMPRCNQTPDSKVHVANMSPTWVLPAPCGPHKPCYQGHIWTLARNYMDMISCCHADNIYFYQAMRNETKQRKLSC